MAKGSKGRKGNYRKVVEEDHGLNEVDSFHAAQDQILLDSASESLGNRKYIDDDNDSDVGVMDIDSASESEPGDISDQYEDSKDDDDDAEFFGKRDTNEEEEEEEGAWGSRKSTYYGADNLEDEESAKQIEEEALRQQKKHLEELNMDDYIDEELEEDWAKNAKAHDFGEVLEEVKPVEKIKNLDPKSRKKYLTTAHPEFIPLTKELTKLNPLLDELKIVKDETEVLNVKFTALSAYLGAITSYLSIFLAFSEEDEPFTMKEHPVMEKILSSKELWRQANDLIDIEEDDDDEEGFKSASASLDEISDEEESVEGNEQDNSEELENSDISENESEEDQEDSDVELDIDISKPRVFRKAKQTNYDDLIEGEIAEVDAEEKKTRKKTLRFYTSKINQQENKKDEKYTGDLDIPYKERLFERQQRLIEEARKRGLNDSNGADLDDNDSFDEQDSKDAKIVNDEFDDSYYESVKASKMANKSDRKQAHTDAVKAAREGKLSQLREDIGEAGKRAVTYQILKNKGLTASKKKTDRNSRVKKRKKYEKAQQKLKSVRSVYTAPSGTYEGEKTGIKKNLSKSVKFGN